MEIDQKEINKISKVLINIFNEDPKLLVEKLELEKCLNELMNNKSLHFLHQN